VREEQPVCSVRPEGGGAGQLHRLPVALPATDLFPLLSALAAADG
jgi:hypothetical protein